MWVPEVGPDDPHINQTGEYRKVCLRSCHIPQRKPFACPNTGDASICDAPSGSASCVLPDTVCHMTTSQDRLAFASTLAKSAGKVLRTVREQNAQLRPAELRNLGDRESQTFIAAQLEAMFPADAVLSEEAIDDKARLSRETVWIVDPLDGTREYAEHRRDWAVHIAIWEAGRLSGVVAMPDADVLLSSHSVEQLPPRDDGPLRIAVSRSRAPVLVQSVAHQLGADLVPMGSAGVKISAVVRGTVDAYVHAGGQYEWDSAAPVAVALAAGAHASRIDGSPLEYNRGDPYLPDLLVCRPELATQLLGAIARAAKTDDGAQIV